jgi:transcription-repair coupling factor (superfamily II helicase)
VERIALYDPVTQLGTSEEVERLIVRPAIEPAAGTEAVTLFDHLAAAAIAIDPEAHERRERFADLADTPAAKAQLLTSTEWKRALKGREEIDVAEREEQPGPRFIEARNSERAYLAALKKARENGDRIVIAGSARDIRFLSRRFEKRAKEAPRAVSQWSEIEQAEPGALLAVIAELERGWTEPGLMVTTAADIIGARSQDPGRATALDPLSHEITDFHIGDAIIHEEHGLGVLRGVEALTASGSEGDAIRIEYAAEAQRLVPVEEAERLWRYGAEADAVSLDRLDGKSWHKRREEIDATIATSARQLVQLAAERAARNAAVLEPDVSAYERFSASFAYSETPDQLRAIEAVRADLASGKPMDRLVVGDVGYGKTEVALRAAAIAALSGKQVAIVAPTTVLVRQHIETFRKRFGRMGIEVAGLSRLSSAAEARAAKKGLADGSIRIVIGTQMVAGASVEFKDLGLVIIDEEQRFGAADKNKLRTLAEGVHVLTLTATPIPRTLQGALVGLQELSLITTPPARRLPTRTSVAGFAPELVRPALIREKRRGGQSFVVVPRIEDMAPMAERLAKLVPISSSARPMARCPPPRSMTRWCASPWRRRCPACHQHHRGGPRHPARQYDADLARRPLRPGSAAPAARTRRRGRQRGYLFLVTEPDAKIAPATLKRLRTMEALDQLGAGFAISARDLDLRGAGELLGEEQAGHMKLIGLGLYQHLLGQALRAARGEQVEDWMPELQLGLTGRLPESWIPEEEVRINLYARIARLSSGAELDALAEELEDRFGSLPEEAHMLLELSRLRQLARLARIARVDAGRLPSR